MFCVSAGCSSWLATQPATTCQTKSARSQQPLLQTLLLALQQVHLSKLAAALQLLALLMCSVQLQQK
jgi:hypothetical protein